MRILIAEDEPVSRRLLARALERWGYEVVIAENGEAAWRILQQADSPSLVIMDWEMPGKDGPQICRDIRSLRKEPYVYVLLLTARKDRQDVIDGLDSGADDYVSKPFNQRELEARLRTGKRIVELHQELIRTREDLRTMALHDPLTGLFNRGAVLDVLRTELARAHRSGDPVAVILGDIDRFKTINDTFGHLTGDEVLRVVARRLQQTGRSYDSVGRYGGEEFLVVVPGCGPKDALKQARRLHHSVRDRSVRLGAQSIDVTISLGIAVYDGLREPEMEALIHAADEALYRAKKAGRDRIDSAGPKLVKTAS